MAELDPAIFFHAADARVEPAHDAVMKLELTLVRMTKKSLLDNIPIIE